MTAGTENLETMRRAARAEGGSTDGTQPLKIDEVVKTYTDAERMDVIAREATEVMLGSPPTKFMMRPLSPRQVITILPKLKAMLKPALELLKARKPGEDLQVATLIEALTENVADLPALMYDILVRANPSLTLDFVLDNFDMVADFEVMRPIFLKQNGLDKLFNLGKQTAPSSGGSNGAGTKQETTGEGTTIVESLGSQHSPAEHTRGNQE